MPAQRTSAQDQIAELLKTARASLGLTMAFLSRLEGDTQHLEVMESAFPLLFKDGKTQSRETSLCQYILDGKLPAVLPDLRDFPEAMKLPAARMPRLRSYVSVPVVLSDGTLYGTFCAAGMRSDRELQERDRALMTVLAHAASLIIEPEFHEQQRRESVEGRILPVLRAGGPSIVFQPIVDLHTLQAVGAEALSRFPLEWNQAPDVAFDEAHSIGVGLELEMLALERAEVESRQFAGYVGMNASPALLLDPVYLARLQRLPLSRVLLELSEHEAVDDYGALMSIIDPLREQGMRLGIDDVGAGFSSLRHIVLTRPDVIKLDRSIVAGAAHSNVLLTLAQSLVRLAQEIGAKTVAEGIEEQADADCLRGIGVEYGQGWLFGRPTPFAAWASASES